MRLLTSGPIQRGLKSSTFSLARPFPSQRLLVTMSTPTLTGVNGFEALSLADSYEVVELAASPVEDQSNAAGSSSSPNRDTMAAEEGKELLITTTPRHIELQRIILPLRGQCPQDLPLDPKLTRGIMDRRMLYSYTVRFRSTDSPSPITTNKQDQVIVAVWSRLKNLAPSHWEEDARPGVVFNSEHKYEKGKQCSVIDVVCTAVELFEVVRDTLKRIVIDIDGQRLFFNQQCWSGSLPGNIFPVDILRLPLDIASSESFYTCLEELVKLKMGKLLGLGLVKFVGAEQDSSSYIARAYVLLNPHIMKLDLADMVSNFPLRLRWEGIEHSLMYEGRSLHKSIEFSLD